MKVKTSEQFQFYNGIGASRGIKLIKDRVLQASFFLNRSYLTALLGAPSVGMPGFWKYNTDLSSSRDDTLVEGAQVLVVDPIPNSSLDLIMWQSHCKSSGI
ncbi:hypothetical protein TNCV_1755041 [Trichonephila clavipes]|nr:hypothetical protein TNCV_1755041 [Trichonephila clavipes]